MSLLADRRLLAALAAAVIAALSWWLASQVETTPPPAAGGGPRAVDYYLKNFTLTAMDADGQPGHRLVAESLQHYADDDTAEIDRPHMTVFRRGETPWLVTATAGRLSMPDEVLRLQGNVRIARDDGPNNAGLELQTRDVTVRLNDEYAETAQPVTIHHQQGVTAAIGMTANLRDGHIELLQQVRGTYVLR
ncbi:MAG: hypothetical protein FD165_2474 [Gammaproteobacteria bacterium]|nr:MAG: hypothetical protein FD165_2474 [Gammaproteobacteria bacterium]TND02939.1 MAG: hypothetical protein FD120_2008 [Gammaproteobacteria bacterium]